MDFLTYIKNGVENLLFIEIKKDVTLKLKGNPVLKKGEYPIDAEDIIDIAKDNINAIPADKLINGMIYIVGSDENFKYNKLYIEFLKKVAGIESYIILKIKESKDKELKRSIIYSTTLFEITKNKEYGMNRIYLLMDLYDKTKLSFLEGEIVSSLKSLTSLYPDYILPCYYLGEYYLNKDLALSKFYLSCCLNDDKIKDEAQGLIAKIEKTEEYDSAVELVKKGEGDKAIKTLLTYIEENPKSPDALYFTAVALRQMGMYKNALQYLDNLLNFGETSETYNEIGLNFASLQKYKSALEYFKSALKIKPQDSEILCNMAVCQFNLGNVKEAKDDFELAERLNPKDEVAKMWLKNINGGN